MPEDISSITSTTRARVLALDPKASYLLTGGLGGLGKSVASWMVECGARSLIFLSRSAGLSDESKAFFNELESLGCSVSAVAGKVQDMENVDKAISKASRPIKGVVHLAMVLAVCQFAILSIVKKTLTSTEGCPNHRHDFQRLGYGDCAEGGRSLEPSSRLDEPTFGLFLPC